jgi:hypothetical protein
MHAMYMVLIFVANWKGFASWCKDNKEALAVVGAGILASSFAFSYILKLQAKAHDFETRLKVAETKLFEVSNVTCYCSYLL